MRILKSPYAISIYVNKKWKKLRTVLVNQIHNNAETSKVKVHTAFLEKKNLPIMILKLTLQNRWNTILHFISHALCW